MKLSPGKIVRIVGVVVDVYFADHIPVQFSALSTGEDNPVILEVQNHLGDNIVRAIAMQSTDGLALDQTVTDLGHPIQTPVGESVLGRVLNVVGETIDGGPAIAAKVERRSIHASAPDLTQQSGKIEILETG